MKIRKLELHNFRSARASAFEFNDKLNLFIGINGAGKSTILDALSICLSWLIKRIEKKMVVVLMSWIQISQIMNQMDT